MDSIREMARALGRRGGRARAESLSPERRSAIASMGGRAAGAQRSKEERKKIARKAAVARWAGVLAGRRIDENVRRYQLVTYLQSIGSVKDHARNSS